MKHLFLLFTTINLGLAQFANASSKELISVLKKNKLNPEHVSFEIRNQTKTMDSLNSQTLMIPASTSKVLTSFAVLKKFDLNHRFKTQLFMKDDNLYIKGGGDPGFVSENMWYLVNVFHRQQIRKINNIYVDDSLFDQVRFDSSRQSVRVDRSYDSPVGAMSFNWNSVNIFVKPTQAGEKAQVYLDPENQYFKLVNKTQTKSGSLSKELVIDVDQDSRTITVSGDVKLGADEKPYYKNVADPIQWTGENLKSFLLQRGIVVKGKVSEQKVPSDAVLVAESESKSVDSVLSDMNKFSNNFVAEMLTKNLAAISGEQPATLKTGVDQIRQSLKSLGLKDSDFDLENPSGFTRKNKISAASLNKVLFALKKDFKIFPSLLVSLPISGVDGTLKKRMIDDPLQGLVRAKTGYLDGAISLAGYLGRPDGDILHFTFLYNGPQDLRTVQQAIDQTLRLYIK